MSRRPRPNPGKERPGKERPGKERPGKERRGKERRGKERRPPGARELAAGIVRGVLAGRGAARTHLERAFERHDLAGAERGFLTELVYGTVRQAGTLDHLLDACAKRGLGRIQEEPLAHLRVAAYQLLFLSRVPPAVAVDAAVRVGGRRPQVRGFLNGVLRGVSRLVAERTPELPEELGAQALTRALPDRDGGWLHLTRDVLPDARSDPGAWLAAAASLPPGLASAWVDRFGLEEALRVARAQNAPPPVFLRANLLQAPREELLHDLEAQGLPARVCTERPEGLALGGALGAGAHEALWAGRASVQDLTAMQVAPFLEPRPGERIVDLCAAPGGKATHLAELMEDRGQVEAVDVPARVGRVQQAAQRLRLSCIRVHAVDPADPLAPQLPAGPPVDRVLVDAPCSNTGVLRRRVEVRWRLASLERAPLLALQARLLGRAAELVRPGGTLVYATCAIDPDENEDQVRALLERRPDLRLETEESSLPTLGGGDGGYRARLRRCT